MERVTLYYREGKQKGVARLRFRLVDGRKITLYHKTGYLAKIKDLEKYENDGELKKRVEVYNKELNGEIIRHMSAMHKAYEKMKEEGLDMTSEVFEREIQAALNPIVEVRTQLTETLCERFLRHEREALRDGVISDNRYVEAVGYAGKLHRFLTIKGKSKITAPEFTVDLLLEFRQFVFDEYLYVPRYKSLYTKDKIARKPTRRLSDASAVQVMSMFRAFFNELEAKDEITKSPFRRLTSDRRKTIFRVMYDEPVFLRQEEFQKVLDTEVPEELSQVKDTFILNCCFGCRIGDFRRLSMDKISVSPEGIPYIHYIPSKTTGSQTTNAEIKTPIIRLAYDIIMRTKFNLGIWMKPSSLATYNDKVRELIKFCGIDRKVTTYDVEKHDNINIPLYEAASSKLARKTHVDMMSKVQVNIYAAGLHRQGSDAVHHYTRMEMKDHFALMNVAFGQPQYHVDKELNILDGESARNQ